MLLQKSKEYWGPDAEEFDPDRWLDERNKTYYLANPFIFIPFLAGPRICLGQQVRPKPRIISAINCPDV